MNVNRKYIRLVEGYEDEYRSKVFDYEELCEKFEPEVWGHINRDIRALKVGDNLNISVDYFELVIRIK